MNNLLKSFLKKTVFRRQNQFLESFDGKLLKSLCKDHKEHIYQKVYESSPDFIKYFFESSKVGRLLKLRTIKRDGVMEIKCQFPVDYEVQELSNCYKAIYGIGFETYQKLYLDRGYNFPKNVVFTDPYGQIFLECNRFSSIGHLSMNASRVNLIAGASETFQLVSKPQDSTQTDENNFLKLVFPFHEVNETISNAIEGANFEIIINSINKLAKRLDGENIEIDIIAGTFGWHNLIYNQTTEDYWKKSLDAIKTNCKKLCIFEVYSPVLHLSNSDIMKFSSAKIFWGSIKPSESSIDELRAAMFRYNNFIKKYSEQNQNILVVPINNLCPILNLEFALNHFLDVNHIINNEAIRAKISKAINSYLSQNSKFFIPDLKKIPEYIYPLF
jgi:hypothetical protein